MYHKSSSDATCATPRDYILQFLRIVTTASGKLPTLYALSSDHLSIYVSTYLHARASVWEKTTKLLNIWYSTLHTCRVE